MDEATRVRFDGVEEKLDRLIECLEGDASAPGLRTRVDRLEQTESRRAWTVRTLVAAMVAVIVKWLHSQFGNS